jgi:glucosamine--fructose-6-phosphate aminotransferase (isomerizing)
MTTIATPDPLDRWRTRLSQLRAEPSTDAAGDAARLARVERTRVEMLAQGAAITATLTANASALARLGERMRADPPTGVMVLGCGDSWFVGQAVAPIIEAATGVPCHGLQAFEHASFGRPALNRGALAIGISAGGNTAAVMDALARARAEGAWATVGVSNTPGSPITTAFDHALIVQASRKGWPTQSSTAAIALLAALGAAAAATFSHPLTDALAALPDRIDAAMASAFQAMRAPAAALAAYPFVTFTGAGSDHAVASFGAAKLRELSSVHAMALPLEEMHHYRLPKPGDAVVTIATAPAARARALDTAITAHASGALGLAILAAPDPEIEALVDHAVVIGQATGPLGVAPAMTAVHALAYHAAIARSAAGLGGPFA